MQILAWLGAFALLSTTILKYKFVSFCFNRITVESNKVLVCNVLVGVCICVSLLRQILRVHNCVHIKTVNPIGHQDLVSLQQQLLIVIYNQGGSSLTTQINNHQTHVFILGIQHQNQHVLAFFLINSMHKGNEGYKNIQNWALHTRNELFQFKFQKIISSSTRLLGTFQWEKSSCS